MTRLRKHLNPALILSIVAVFIALGGGAYAAISANSVGTKQLKNNAVTAKKLKKNAVTLKKIAKNAISTPKIKNDAVTGNKVLESSLGEVPSAAKATNAVQAMTAVSAESAAQLANLQRLGLKHAAPSASNDAIDIAQANATEIPLFELGSIAIYGKCFKSAGRLYAAQYIRTSANGAIFVAAEDSAFGDPSFLDTTTPESEREIFSANAEMDDFGYTPPSSTYALTAQGKAYTAYTNVFVKQGTLPGGDGPYGPGDACLFTGSFGEGW